MPLVPLVGVRRLTMGPIFRGPALRHQSRGIAVITSSTRIAGTKKPGGNRAFDEATLLRSDPSMTDLPPAINQAACELQGAA